jgi:hypothetical protein
MKTRVASLSSTNLELVDKHKGNSLYIQAKELFRFLDEFYIVFPDENAVRKRLIGNLRYVLGCAKQDRSTIPGWESMPNLDWSAVMTIQVDNHSLRLWLTEPGNDLLIEKWEFT